MKDVASRLSGISFIVASVALLVGFAHYWLGPIDPPPGPEQVAAERVVAAGQAAWARLRHVDPPRGPDRAKWGSDRTIDAAASFFGAFALLLASIAYARGER
jgi:hypothetical protein